MSQFIANSQAYNITTENEVATILSRFNSNYIFDIVKDNLANKYSNYYFITNPNIVGAFEQNFKNLKERYPFDTQNIEFVRTETYKEIIQILCKEYNLQFNDTGDLDYFSLAFYMYDFLASNFNKYLTFFFANYIYKEKNSIYESLNLDNMKKNKDSGTVYNKKIYKDSRLAVINANLPYVIQFMSGFDITLEVILNHIYPNKTIVSNVLSYIAPIDDFYKLVYCRMMTMDINPIVITNIRLEIQKMISPENTI